MFGKRKKHCQTMNAELLLAAEDYREKYSKTMEELVAARKRIRDLEWEKELLDNEVIGLREELKILRNIESE